MSTEPDKLESLARRLPRAIAPERDLWPGIATRLAAQSSRRQAWRYGLVASVLAACGALAFWLAAGGPASQDGQMGNTPLVTIPGTNTASANTRFASLRSPARATLSGNYRVVERAIAAIEAALQKDPNNPYLRGLLNQAYQDRAALDRAGERAQTNPYLRNDL